MAADIIRYDLMVQDALRGVVRKVLTEAAREGLPGEHHFYITFRTHAPGVRLSTRMREKYPEEMTVILQHQFWDLSVTEQNFEVGLSFGGVSERLLIPFEAITGFFDPSVQFGLKFEVVEATPEQGANDTAPVKTKPGAGKPAILPQKSSSKKSEGEPQPAPAAQGKAPAAGKPAKQAPASAATETATPPKVVSIDAFRKKP